MRNLFQRLVVFLSAFAASFFALTPTVFATGIPYTGDDNKVGLVIGLLVVSVIVIIALLVLSAASKKKKGRK